MQTPILKVIADGNNEVGDTLTRLATDVFQTLGYEDLRINIHKAGRELDIQGRHPYENRILVAECKAQKSPVGGGDINKFVGAVDAERRQAKGAAVHAYYVSLSGYTETARQQEYDVGNSRVTLLANSDIVKRIVESKIVVSPAEAAATAGAYAATVQADIKFSEIELYAHPIGWLWATHFTDEDGTNFICLVHADGHLVPQSSLPNMDVPGAIFLAPQKQRPGELHRKIWQIYNRYLEQEYGAITLEGMPVDQEVGSRSFRLEDLYVPVEFEQLGSEKPKGLVAEDDRTDPRFEPALRRFSIGQLLSSDNHIAILGPPGSGKSTLVKRLAVAYSDRSRLHIASDDLPGVRWRPIAIRCRHLTDSAGKPIFAILQESICRAEHADLEADFGHVLGEELREGNVLLLIDGLDEIPTPGARSSFVGQLRTFLSRYPRTKLVLTSREVGFRQVAGTIYTLCSVYKVAELSDEDIEQLVVAWHREVVGRSATVRTEAKRLTAVIITNDRVRRLAVNPLLLTTLLLVKRWVGQLPRKRTVLYQKAIEVLLMTWNVEGHEPIDLDEALPQLGYAAYKMMTSKTSSVSASQLAKLFQDARADLPELLAYSTVSVQAFLGRVEERSSLLVLSGHSLAQSGLLPIYEFKHLTFQEYLAALAISNRWLPRSEQDKSLIEILSPLLTEPMWSEVVKMASVLAGRESSKIVESLIGLAQGRPVTTGNRQSTNVACDNLIGCLGDDVPLAPERARQAISAALRYQGARRHLRRFTDLCAAVLGGRYDRLLRDVVLEGASQPELGVLYGQAVQRIAELDTEQFASAESLLAGINIAIRSRLFEDQIMGAARLMTVSYAAREVRPRQVPSGRIVWESGLPVLSLPSLRTALDYVAKEVLAIGADVPPALPWMQTWALAWGGKALTKSEARVTALRSTLFERWMHAPHADWRRMSGWALGGLPSIGNCYSERSQGEIQKFLHAAWKDLTSDSVLWKSVFVAAYYFDFVWPREILASMLIDSLRKAEPYRLDEKRLFARPFLKQLGDAGAAALKDPILIGPRAGNSRVQD